MGHSKKTEDPNVVYGTRSMDLVWTFVSQWGPYGGPHSKITRTYRFVNEKNQYIHWHYGPNRDIKLVMTPGDKIKGLYIIQNPSKGGLNKDGTAIDYRYSKPKFVARQTKITEFFT